MRRTRIPALIVSFGLITAMGVTLFAKERHDGPSPLFMEHCARCHGEDGTGTLKGRLLMARDLTDRRWASARSDDDLMNVIANGRKAMPPFGRKLTPEQIESLVKNDVRSFAKQK